jgi:hypothetical protein
MDITSNSDVKQLNRLMNNLNFDFKEKEELLTIVFSIFKNSIKIATH